MCYCYMLQGEFIGIIGAVGSGKSSLLFSLLNEMKIIPNLDNQVSRLGYK